MTISTGTTTTPMDAGRHLLRPRFLLALAFVLSLSWITFTNHDAISSTANQSVRRTRKTVAESLILAEKNYQKTVNNRMKYLREQKFDTDP
jgi:hypothetical protein